MKFQVSSQLAYQAKFPSTMILSILPQRNAFQEIEKEKLTITPQLKHEELLVEDNRFLRLQTGKTTEFKIHYKATVDCQIDLLPTREIDEVPVAQLDTAAILYLFPSRYCQSDRLARFAWDFFGQYETAYEKVLKITEWIYQNIEYLPGTTNSQTSAYDSVTQRTGVCRDFAHLAIAFCRALNIPARYFTGYAYQLDPPDFHACFEAHLDGRWLIFDPTHLSSLNGLVKIANGRDAADAAVATVFGSVQCKSMTVDCRLVPGQKFQPLKARHLERKGVSLEQEEILEEMKGETESARSSGV